MSAARIVVTEFVTTSARAIVHRSEESAESFELACSQIEARAWEWFDGDSRLIHSDGPSFAFVIERAGEVTTCTHEPGLLTVEMPIGGRGQIMTERRAELG